MPGKYDFRSEPSKELELIDQEPIEEEHHFATIYDELLFKRSHNNPDYIDPAIAAKIIMKQVDKKIEEHNKEVRTMFLDLATDLKKLFARDLDTENKINTRKKNVSRMWGIQ